MLSFIKRRGFSTVAVLALAMSLVFGGPMNAFALSGSLKLSGSTTVQPVAEALKAGFVKKNPSVSMAIAGGGSGVGISDVLAGRVNIGMSSRALKSTEKSKGAVGYAIARDALTVVVNPNNPVKNLSADQIKKIYSGKITNWKQVGGKDARIVVVGRTAASGTYDFFKEKFMVGATMSSTVKAYSSNGLVRSAVAGNKNAIGYLSMAFVNTTVRGVSVGGVAPTRTNALSGKYKYVRYLWFITKGSATGLRASFINYARGTSGQDVVKKYYLPYH
ncbi:MAG: phosphate ABC transporter substrate-binding protein [Coriobacteriales bacterium]|nr:phosphate ABC transporter substrate-binding protein [Coriobacteriales bacterium]